MNKKDFELIASALCESRKLTPLYERYALDIVVDKLTQALASKNPRFQKDKFLEACGVEPEKILCIDCNTDITNKDNQCIACIKKRCLQCCKFR